MPSIGANVPMGFDTGSHDSRGVKVNVTGGRAGSSRTRTWHRPFGLGGGDGSDGRARFRGRLRGFRGANIEAWVNR